MAPEVLELLVRGRRHLGYTYSADWWSLGALIYVMLTDQLPFPLQNSLHYEHSKLFEALEFPSTASPDVVDLVSALMTIDPKERLGYGKHGLENIRAHPFFSDVKWNHIVNKTVKAPLVPAEFNPSVLGSPLADTDRNVSTFDNLVSDLAAPALSREMNQHFESW